jgi:hypothetical protein
MPSLDENCDSDAEDELECCVLNTSFNAVLSVSADEKFLHDIHTGYEVDDFCRKLSSSEQGMPGIHLVNGLWYIGDRLLIPCYGSLHEDLF